LLRFGPARDGDGLARGCGATCFVNGEAKLAKPLNPGAEVTPNTGLGLSSFRETSLSSISSVPLTPFAIAFNIGVLGVMGDAVDEVGSFPAARAKGEVVVEKARNPGYQSSVTSVKHFAAKHDAYARE
jgi:hypothetical protein